MSDKSAIEWTDATWNPTTGCTKIPGTGGSPSGCDNCYAETFAERFRGVPGHHFENGFDLTLRPEGLTIPRRWKRPRRIFVNSMSDLFHVGVPDEFIARVWMEMLTCRRHTFQVLTKRPERMRRLVKRVYENGFPSIQFYSGAPNQTAAFDVDRDVPNIWLGVSIATNDDAWRADMLRETPAAVRFLSVEPLLGPVDKVDLTGIDWVIVGGESGRSARPMHPDWIREVRDRCVAAGVAFFFKQHGEWVRADRDRATHLVHVAGRYVPIKNAQQNVYDGRGIVRVEDLVDRGHPGWTRVRRVGKKVAGRVLDGRTWDEFPAVHG